MTVAASVLGIPLPAAAQQAARVRRIGILTAGSLAALPASLFEALRELGWIEGQNLMIDRRTGNGHAERVPALAAGLVRAPVEVIVTFGAVAGVAAKNATNSIPIVATTGDPVAFGLVPNMSHPGGNITGIALIAPALAAKRLELLRELLPSVARVGELVDPANSYWHSVRKDYEQTFLSLRIDPIFIEVSGPAELEKAILEIGRRRAQALIVRGDPLFISNGEQIAHLAVANALPTVAEERVFSEAGMLISYGPLVAPLTRRTAFLVDRILNGARRSNSPRNSNLCLT